MRKSLVALVALTLTSAACGDVPSAEAGIARPVATSVVEADETPTATTPTLPDFETTATGVRLPRPPSTTVPPLPTTTLPPEEPQFQYVIRPVTAETVARSWREECPLHWEELTLLSLSYWNFDGRPVMGRMVVNTSVVDDIVAIFERLFEIKFPIERIALVDDYASTNAAFRSNVTVAFNCRYVDGTERWSNHAFGLAVDINPLVNPWDREDNVLPLEGEPFTDRSRVVQGMINEGDRVVQVFEEQGWSWGGTWVSADYMHFSRPGN